MLATETILFKKIRLILTSRLVIKLGNRWFFKPSVFISAITLLMLITFLSLSHWQYEKAQYKFEITDIQTSLLSKTPDNTYRLTLGEAIMRWQQLSALSTSSGQALNDLKVEVIGNIIPNWLLFHDNRVHNWQAGYHVLTLMQVNHPVYNAILINLGWTPLVENRRDKLPKIFSRSTLLTSEMKPWSAVSEHTLAGTIEIPIQNKGLFALAEAENFEAQPVNVEFDEQDSLNITSHRWRVQKIDIKQAQQVANVDLEDLRSNPIRIAPFVVRAEASFAHPTLKMNEQLVKEWKPILKRGISGEKHLGYALQWLAFAILLLALYICLNTKPLTSHTETEKD